MNSNIIIIKNIKQICLFGGIQNLHKGDITGLREIMWQDGSSSSVLSDKPRLSLSSLTGAGMYSQCVCYYGSVAFVYRSGLTSCISGSVYISGG